MIETQLHEGAVVEIAGQDVAVLHYKKCNTIQVRLIEKDGGRTTAFTSALVRDVPETGTIDDARRIAAELQPVFANWVAEEAARIWAADHRSHDGPSFGVGR